SNHPSQQQVRPRFQYIVSIFSSHRVPTPNSLVNHSPKMEDIFRRSDLDDIAKLEQRCNDHLIESYWLPHEVPGPKGLFWHGRLKHWLDFATVALTHLGSQNERIQSLEKRLKESRAMVDNPEAEAESSRARVTALNAELEKAHSTIASLSQALSNLTSSLNKTAGSEQQQPANRNLEARVEELEGLVKELSTSYPVTTPASTVPATPVMAPTTAPGSSPIIAPRMEGPPTLICCVNCSEYFSTYGDYEDHLYWDEQAGTPACRAPGYT
ncbi:hypothetical protein QBC41DRAFT_391461, partial [Cercophora samala]